MAAAVLLLTADQRPPHICVAGRGVDVSQILAFLADQLPKFPIAAAVMNVLLPLRERADQFTVPVITIAAMSLEDRKSVV